MVTNNKYKEYASNCRVNKEVRRRVWDLYLGVTRNCHRNLFALATLITIDVWLKSLVFFDVLGFITFSYFLIDFQWNCRKLGSYAN